MKIRIDSNFVLPGMEDVNEIDLRLPHINLRKVLEELTLRSSGRVKFIRPMTDSVDPMDFLIEINAIARRSVMVRLAPSKGNGNGAQGGPDRALMARVTVSTAFPCAPPAGSGGR